MGKIGMAGQELGPLAAAVGDAERVDLAVEERRRFPGDEAGGVELLVRW